MMRFALLASGSKGNCFIVRDGSTRLVIDCGSTLKYLRSCFSALQVNRDKISAVLITHDHSDHIAQIRHFAGYKMYSPVDIADICRANVVSRMPFSVGSLTITPLALSHDARNTSGYIIENGQEKLVYITDTGYVNESYLPLIAGADYYVMESNHDPAMLMRTRRPQYLKARIYSDQGHLCNQDCADILSRCITPATRMIILAHISQEANTRELALETTASQLRKQPEKIGRDLVVCAAGQFEMIRKGDSDEEMDPGTVCWFAGMESLADHQS